MKAHSPWVHGLNRWRICVLVTSTTFSSSRLSLPWPSQSRFLLQEGGSARRSGRIERPTILKQCTDNGLLWTRSSRGLSIVVTVHLGNNHVRLTVSREVIGHAPTVSEALPDQATAKCLKQSLKGNLQAPCKTWTTRLRPPLSTSCPAELRCLQELLLRSTVRFRRA